MSLLLTRSECNTEATIGERADDYQGHFSLLYKFCYLHRRHDLSLCQIPQGVKCTLVRINAACPAQLTCLANTERQGPAANDSRICDARRWMLDLQMGRSEGHTSNSVLSTLALPPGVMTIRQGKRLTGSRHEDRI
jgi:hypothetical protein